jgi:hypothetical protein
VACAWLSLVFVGVVWGIGHLLTPGPIPSPTGQHLIGVLSAVAGAVAGSANKGRASDRKFLLWMLWLLPVAVAAVAWTETRGLPPLYHAAEAVALLWWLKALQLLQEELRKPGFAAELQELAREEATRRHRNPRRRPLLPMQRQRALQPRNQRPEANLPPPKQP